MYDNVTGDAVVVCTSEECGLYIMIEPEQLGRVEQLLTKNRIAFTVEDGPCSCMENPEAAVIAFGKHGDTKLIQRVLDSIP